MTPFQDLQFLNEFVVFCCCILKLCIIIFVGKEQYYFFSFEKELAIIKAIG